jgi:hypothetical protein
MNQKGQTLVSALIGIGVTAVMAVIIASVLATQARENRALGEKMASLDLQRTIISTLANAMSCNGLFAPSNVANGGSGSGGSPPAGGGGGGLIPGVVSAIVKVINSTLAFDLTLITPTNPLVFSIKQIPGVAGAPPIISAGDKVSPMTNTLFLLPSNAPTPGIQMIVTSASTAILRLNFDHSKLVHPIRSLEFPLNIQTSGTPTQTTIQGCSNLNTPAAWQCLSLGGDWFTPGSLYCVRIVDGTHCRLGSNSNGFFGNHIRSSNWNCTGAGTLWPGGGPWACSVASSTSMMTGLPNGQPACVRTSDGMLCTLTTHFDFWGRSSGTPKWRCLAGGGWPVAQ